MQVFVQKGSLYAFKGLAGRLGPIGVHAALLLVLGGTSYSGFGGYKGSVMTPEVWLREGVVAICMHPHRCTSRVDDLKGPLTPVSLSSPQGQDFIVANYMRPASPIATLPASAASSIHVDDFTIDYRPDGSVAQFYSTLTLTDPQVWNWCGRECGP